MAIALLALSLSQAAEAKKKASPCLTQDEVAALLSYAMPSVIEGVAATCKARLANTGFLAKSVDSMTAKYSEGRDAAWPGARAAFLKLSDDKDDRELLEGLRDDTLRPLVSDALANLMLEEVKPESCGKAERLLQATNNIAPDDFAGFLSALLALVVDDKDKDMPICEA